MKYHILHESFDKSIYYFLNYDYSFFNEDATLMDKWQDIYKIDVASPLTLALLKIEKLLNYSKPCKSCKRCIVYIKLRKSLLLPNYVLVLGIYIYRVWNYNLFQNKTPPNQRGAVELPFLSLCSQSHGKACVITHHASHITHRACHTERTVR